MSCEHGCRRRAPVQCAKPCASITEHRYHRCEDHAGDADLYFFGHDEPNPYGQYRPGVVERLVEARQRESAAAAERQGGAECGPDATAAQPPTAATGADPTLNSVRAANGAAPLSRAPCSVAADDFLAELAATGAFGAEADPICRCGHYRSEHDGRSEPDLCDSFEADPLDGLPVDSRDVCGDTCWATDMPCCLAVGHSGEHLHRWTRPGVEAEQEQRWGAAICYERLPSRGPCPWLTVHVEAEHLRREAIEANRVRREEYHATPRTCPTCSHPLARDATCGRHCTATSLEWHGCLLAHGHEGPHQSNGALGGGFWEFESNGGQSDRRFGPRGAGLVRPPPMRVGLVAATTRGPIGEVVDRLPARVTVSLPGGGFVFLCERCSYQAERESMRVADLCARCQSGMRPTRAAAESVEGPAPGVRITLQPHGAAPTVRAQRVLEGYATATLGERLQAADLGAWDLPALFVEEPASPSWLHRILRAEPLVDRLVRWWRSRRGPTVAEINRALVTGKLGLGTSGLPVDE